ncbi:uncharacterized protein LOC143240447 [Tachypleus tridentatus]|uniref:uncharacterized protein LOC143240447 n=1 Tax=Tachypleus tridentatus TaxID=6853 RepID=UPI003FCFE748
MEATLVSSCSKRIGELTHENLVRFIGMCIDEPHYALLTEHCIRGSLRDMLEKDAMNIDWTFRYSMVNDILEGMKYIHDSSLEYHGRLKSTNCVIDGRFMVKITDYGLKYVHEQVDLDTEINPRSLFWMAPEHLREPYPTKTGSKKGDIYSFAIILQEIITRSGPFRLEERHGSNKGIVDPEECSLFHFMLLRVPGIKLKPVHIYDDQTAKDIHAPTAVLTGLPTICGIYIHDWGDKVVLPCNITPPSPDDSVALVLWYRGNSGNPIYSVDARNEPVQEGKHFASDVLGSRAKFNISLKTSFLVIEPVKDDDGGEYRCRVDFRRGRTQNRKLKVNIIVPPQDIYIKTGDGRFQDVVFGPFNEGSSLKLACEAIGGIPPPSVTWWKESDLMDNSYFIPEKNVVVNILEIKVVERYLSKGTLTCQAQNTNLTMPKSVTIRLDVNCEYFYRLKWHGY